MKSKLGIDFDKVGHAREMARKIADQVQDFVDGYTTVLSKGHCVVCWVSTEWMFMLSLCRTFW